MTRANMYFTPDRLLLVAVVISLISVDGFYRALKQRQSDVIGSRLFAIYVTVLALGTVLVWVGFLSVWL